MQNKALSKIKIALLAVLVVAVWFASDLPKASESVMVRAVLLEEENGVYTVAVLYQSPQASADSASVQAQVLLEQASAQSLAGAFAQLEQAIASEVSYKICDYVLLCGQFSKSALEEYAAHLQSVQQGQLSARLCYTNRTTASIAEIAKADDTCAQTLLQSVEQGSDAAPRVYEAGSAQLVIPFVFIDTDNAIAQSEKLFLLADGKSSFLSEEEASYYRLLTEHSGTCILPVYESDIQENSTAQSNVQEGSTQDSSAQAESFTVNNRLVSVAVSADGQATVRVYAVVTRAQDVTELAIANMDKSLEESLAAFLSAAYTDGWDVLQITAYDALANGETGSTRALEITVEVCLLPLVKL